MLQPSVVYTEAEPPSLKSLITDPYIVLAAGTRNENKTCDFILNHVSRETAKFQRELYESRLFEIHNFARCMAHEWNQMYGMKCTKRDRSSCLERKDAELNTRRRSRRDYVREHGNRYVGAEPADLDDGHDGREPLEAGGHVFAG